MTSTKTPAGSEDDAANTATDEQLADEAGDDYSDEPGPGDDKPSATRWRNRIGIAVALLLALAVGFSLGAWLALPKHPGENSPEAGFARDMTTHHGQAVAMAMLEYRNGSDGQLRQIAYDMATTQQAQIGIMDQWLTEWKVSTTADEPMSWMPDGKELLKDGLMPGMATPAQMEQMRTLTGHDLDVLFAQLMINHHIGGIHMIDAVIAEGSDEDVIELAKGMKRAQQYEIDVLEQKLREFGVTR